MFKLYVETDKDSGTLLLLEGVFGNIIIFLGWGIRMIRYTSLSITLYSYTMPRFGRLLSTLWSKIAIKKNIFKVPLNGDANGSLKESAKY